ncbi:sigma-70 family RNA polymerase sigma factor [Oceanobacillus piezotolerans]|uniref:Sigma-70 family RNA polymerase sigma factor n=1 Tax=Oceanobacillus piezotolerans TaxID=2448030 RepID=A0A498D8R2_9BACI|nr:sigma-70 family RNA polymerase sigma factor [Oceanobacillus piezotolerans]RLL46946.1 sigma-70 family RNA polymerase sigma factor [Oceanobacillus piezotolerans]
MDKPTFTFEEILEQNERRIHYQIQKLNIRDPHHEFFQEGLVAMWNAYETYQPDKGPLATYFNFTIRNRLIDRIRKENRIQEKTELIVENEKKTMNDGNYQRSREASTLIPNLKSEVIDDHTFWNRVKAPLSDKQWKWVKQHIIEEKSLKEIAEAENVSLEAVKSWGKTARKKLRDLKLEDE